MGMYADTVGVKQPGAARHAQLLALFTATIFLSAFLLFSVQPFFAKMVLPRLGGSPGVWSVAMVFFQSVLLLGYCYSHVLSSRLSMRWAIGCHAVVLALAFASLPILIPAGWEEPPQAGQEFWLLALFGLSVGLPFFSVSATGPLLQAWFSRTGHPHASNPYFLYGASNLGSFASLFLFVAFFEPWFTVSTQSQLWSSGFGALAVLILLCGFLTFRLMPATERGTAVNHADGTRERSSLFQILRWIGLAFVPSGLLVAVTAHISIDVAAAPLLWVAPLSLYLLSFVFAFKREPLFDAKQLSEYLPLTAAFSIMIFYLSNHLPIWLVLAASMVIFFMAALICHSLLAHYRPAASNLTSFYMWMSLGGVLGGIFSSIISPSLFNWIAEYPLLGFALLLCRPSLYASGFQLLAKACIAAIAAGSILYFAFHAGMMPFLEEGNLLTASINMILVGAVAAKLRSQALHAAMVVFVVPLVVIGQQIESGVYAERSFFGVLKVVETPDGQHRELLHGTTLHGSMRIRDENGIALTGRPEPLSYYHKSGGIALSLRAAQTARGGALKKGGIVGLGTGSLLCHSRPGENWTVYEIDKSVIDTASNPAFFRFVSECGADAEMVLGDARIMLEKQEPGKFDYLLLDAFSSDSIPVHLLTREAVRMYMNKLADDGMLVIHISNRYFELESLVAAIARDSGLAIRVAHIPGPKNDPDSEFILGPKTAVLARSEQALGELKDDPQWHVPDPMTTTPWTDDYSDILSALLRNR